MAIIIFHDEFVWLDQPCMITKEVIEWITGLWSTRSILIMREMKNSVVANLTGTALDGRAI